MKAELGQEVGITYDWKGDGRGPQAGDVLRTRTGRCYLVLRARQVRSKVSPCRLKLRAVVVDPAELEGGFQEFELGWYPRVKRGGR